MKKIKTTIRIDEKLLKEIKKKAIDEKISMNEYIIRLFKEDVSEKPGG